MVRGGSVVQINSVKKRLEGLDTVFVAVAVAEVWRGLCILVLKRVVVGMEKKSSEGVKRAADGLIRRNVNQILGSAGLSSPLLHLHVYVIRSRRRGNNRK